jgi:RNA polymerase sigma-70 factor (ECF subfamily)
LGDLVYADRPKPQAPAEDKWVELVQAAGAGDQLALHALYARTHRMVFTLIMRITNNRETAEEVTLDVFHDVWRRAAAYDPAGGPVLGWIMNQARSRAIDRLRFERRKKRVDPRAKESVPAAVVSDSEDTLDLENRCSLLREALAMLTPDEKQVIETAYFSELTYAEIEERLGQPLGTVKTRIRSGLGKLRLALAPRARES